MTDSRTDSELVAAARRGERRAFEALIERYETRITGIVAKHVPSHDVDAVAQEVFVSVYRSLGRLKSPDAWSSWISGIAVRRCYDYWRAVYRRREVLIAPLDSEACDWLDRCLSDESEQMFSEEQERRHADALLQWALAQLSPADRTVLTLTAIEERSTEEAASLLGWTRTNVKVRAMRARKKLRALLESQAEETR